MDMVRGADRGQSGLDRLLYFAVVVLLVVAAVPHVFGVYGGSQAPADAADDLDPGAGTADLRVLGVRGALEDGEVSRLTVVVALAGDGSLDLAGTAVGLFGDGAAHLLPGNAQARPGVGGTYAIRTGGPDADGTTLTGPVARGRLVFDLDGGSGPGSVGRLAAGESVTVRLLLADGRAVTRTVTVPDPLPERRPVPLG